MPWINRLSSLMILLVREKQEGVASSAEGQRESGGHILLFGPQFEGKEKLTTICTLTF